MATFRIKNWVALLLLPDYSITLELIHLTDECAHDLQAPRGSIHKGEKRNNRIREEYSLNLANSAEFVSRLAPLSEVNNKMGPGCLNR